MISIVKFKESGTQIGPSSYAMSYLENGQVVDTYKMELVLDRANRVIQMTGTHINKPTDKYFQWIPLESVSTILFASDPNGKPVYGNDKKQA